MAALAGANQIYGAGMIESGVTFDCAQLVMDDEIAAMIKHCVMGIPVDDETLAVEDIAQVGAFGDFLSLDATLRHMRSLSQPRLMDRRVREDWEERGGSDLYARARSAALEIVESHTPQPVDPDAARRVRRIVEDADRERGVVSPARS
jgi:trimethylamine---corrinoid protein Co-methyltransferase